MGRNVASNLKTYNSTKHSTTNMTPNEAKREDKLKVWLNIKNEAEFNRKYPPLSVGSFVRTYEPPKHKKGYKYVWSSKVYKIICMNDNGYPIDDYPKKKMCQRNELLKIQGNEDKEG